MASAQHPVDLVWAAFTSLPINDDRSPERKARWEEAAAEIRDGRYERPQTESKGDR